MPTLQEQIEGWDGECVVVRYDRPTGTWVFIAVHDRTLGMAMGGCRLKAYDTPVDGLKDAQRLAAGMTLKWAGIEFPLGGGKAVLATPGPLAAPDREGLLLRFGDLVEGLGGLYGTGVDLGTTPDDMSVIGRRTERVAGRRTEDGGAGDPGPWTALGVFEGMRAAAERVWGAGGLEGRTVVIQGAGGVGRPLAERLGAAGARLIVTDTVAERAKAVAEDVGGSVVDPGSAYEIECDFFAPCAVGAVLNRDTVGRLRCAIVAGSANNQLDTDEDADRLADRGIVYVPDFIINAGGAVAHGILEFLGWPEADVEPRVRKIGETVGAVLDRATADGSQPLTAAEARARQVLEGGLA